MVGELPGGGIVDFGEDGEGVHGEAVFEQGRGRVWRGRCGGTDCRASLAMTKGKRAPRNDIFGGDDVYWGWINAAGPAALAASGFD